MIETSQNNSNIFFRHKDFVELKRTMLWFVDQLLRGISGKKGPCTCVLKQQTLRYCSWLCLIWKKARRYAWEDLWSNKMNKGCTPKTGMYYIVAGVTLG